MSNRDIIRQQAEELAKANREAEPTISDVYWFPHDIEVRLIEIDTLVPTDPDRQVHPFYFRPAPEDGLTAPSDIALIHPSEVENITLPDGWGSWQDAVKLEAG